MPMGASACSMAKSSNNLQQYPSSSMSSHRSSPILYDNAAAGSSGTSEAAIRGPLTSNNIEKHQAQYCNTARSLPGSVGQSPARTVSADEASAALANLLEIDDTPANRNASRRVYQHALSVRVPPNEANQQQQQGMNGAVPRRKRSNNQTEEN